VENLKPFHSRQAEDLKVGAEAAISIFFDPSQGRKKILFEKEANKKLPIASLTKLMTANIVLENYDLSQEIEISKAAVSQESEFGNLKIGEKFLVKDLMYPLLMESSNDAAYALAELYGVESFIELMNSKAQDLGLFDTSFVNPTGLDPDSLNELGNYSTVQDLARLSENLLLEKPLIWEILAMPQFDLYSPDGVFHHKLLNTNELLRQDGWAGKIIGGKTGWTPKAKGCLVLVIKAPNSSSYLINVILESEDRFGEMKKLVDWVNIAYKW
jgi:D-alanyl-D-alanine carboxypeptidase